MRLHRRTILAIAAAFVLQMALCPAECLAGSPERAAAAQSAHADSDPEQASSHDLPPCHQGKPSAPEDVPGDADGDCSSVCASCRAGTPHVYTAERVSQPPSLAVIAFLQVIAPTARGTSSTPSTPDHDPPPVDLILLKSSFLL